MVKYVFLERALVSFKVVVITCLKSCVPHFFVDENTFLYNKTKDSTIFYVICQQRQDLASEFENTFSSWKLNIKN